MIGLPHGEKTMTICRFHLISERYRQLGKSGSTDSQSQKKLENERHTATSRQKRQRVNIYCEISTLTPFISIACLLLAFPHVENVKYI